MLHANITTSLSTSADNGAIFSTKYKSVGLSSYIYVRLYKNL